MGARFTCCNYAETARLGNRGRGAKVNCFRQADGSQSRSPQHFQQQDQYLSYFTIEAKGQMVERMLKAQSISIYAPAGMQKRRLELVAVTP